MRMWELTEPNKKPSKPPKVLKYLGKDSGPKKTPKVSIYNLKKARDDGQG